MQFVLFFSDFFIILHINLKIDFVRREAERLILFGVRPMSRWKETCPVINKG
jgi:hypothetical protein